MQVSLEKFTSAMLKVKKLAEGQKNVPGIMLELAENEMSVCYSDGKKSMIEKIQIEGGNDTLGRVVVPYTRMMNVVEICQPSGPIFTGELTIEFETDNVMTVSASKMIEIMAEDGENTETKVVSTVSQKVGFAKPEDSIQYGVLSRMDYASIFEHESFDVWDVSELREVLGRLAGEKNKVIYVSSNMQSAFVINLAHVTNIPILSCDENGMTLSTNVANSLVDILARIDAEKVNVCVKDSRYANITSDDNTIGIWFEMAPANKNELVTLQRYQEKEYDKYKLIVCRPAIQNVISCAMASDNNEKNTLLFKVLETGELEARISTVNTGASSANDFTVVMEAYTDKDGDIEEAKLPVTLKVLYDMLSNCKEDYINIDVASDDGGLYIRVSDRVDTGQEVVMGTTHYTVSNRS